jgi:hypothetical protein
MSWLDGCAPLDEQYEDFDERPLRCVACGGWFDPDDTVWVRPWRRPVCGHCCEAREGE